MCLQGNPAVFTLSMHAANNFPARKQKSTLDVPLPDGMQDDDYLRYCVGWGWGAGLGGGVGGSYKQLFQLGYCMTGLVLEVLVS